MYLCILVKKKKRINCSHTVFSEMLNMLTHTENITRDVSLPLSCRNYPVAMTIYGLNTLLLVQLKVMPYFHSFHLNLNF